MVNSGPAMRFDAGQSEREWIRRWSSARRSGRVFDIRAVVAFRLDIGLPLAAEAIEIVHKIAAHEGLQGLVDIGEAYTPAGRLLAIDIDVDCGTAGR